MDNYCEYCGGRFTTQPGMIEKLCTCDVEKQKPELTGTESSVNVEAEVIKPTQFVWMPYKCDNCEKAIRIKLKVISEYGNLEDIDPPYFCKNCEDAIEAL